MSVLIVNQAEVVELLPMSECIEVMAEALLALSVGDATQPLRPVFWLPEQVGLLCMMPSFGGHIQAAGVKVFSVFPGNHGTAFDVHQGIVCVFDVEHGSLQAIVDATSITAIRTAAVSAVATRCLARPGARNLAILGSGTQAHAHLEAMLLVRPIQRVRVWSPTPEHSRRFAEQGGERHGISIEVTATAGEAVKNADLICTATASNEPVLRGEWLAPGAHINAAGSSLPTTRELDTDAVVCSRLFVDRAESTINEAGDFLLPKAEGAIGDEHILGEVGQVLAGRIEGRTSPDEITLFKSLGLGIEDLASAHHVWVKAVAAGLGTTVEIGGRRHSSVQADPAGRNV
jgi:ornithine cyclodeaminase